VRTDSCIVFTPGAGRFPLVAQGRAAPIVVSASDFPGVTRVGGDLRADVERVTGVRPAVFTDTVPETGEVVLVGTIGKSPLIAGAGRGAPAAGRPPRAPDDPPLYP
jgi:hypothetical protein